MARSRVAAGFPERAIRELEFTPDGRFVLCRQESPEANVVEDEDVSVAELLAGPVWSLDGVADSVWSCDPPLCLGSAAVFFAEHVRPEARSSAAEKARLWLSRSGDERVWDLTTFAPAFSVARAHGSLGSLAIDAGGTHLLVVLPNDETTTELALMEVASGEVRRTGAMHHARLPALFPQFTAGGERVLVPHAHGCQLLDVKTHRVLWSQGNLDQALRSIQFSASIFSPTERFVVSAHQRGLTVFDAETGSRVGDPAGIDQPISALAHLDERALLFAAQDGSLWRWEVEVAAPVQLTARLPNGLVTALGSSVSRVAAGYSDGTLVVVQRTDPKSESQASR